MYCSVSHFGPSVEEIHSLDEIVNPGTQGLTGLVGMFLLGFRDKHITFKFFFLGFVFGVIGNISANFGNRLDCQGERWQEDAIFQWRAHNGEPKDRPSW